MTCSWLDRQKDRHGYFWPALQERGSGGPMENHYQLRRQEIHKIIGDQSLKKWWIAEFTGVHKTTLRRWLQGKIQFVRKHHAEQLAQVLQSKLSEIADPVFLSPKTGREPNKSK